eukprot:598097-Prorocentrum_minimum.AAC.1
MFSEGSGGAALLAAALRLRARSKGSIPACRSPRPASDTPSHPDTSRDMSAASGSTLRARFARRCFSDSGTQNTCRQEDEGRDVKGCEALVRPLHHWRI